LPGKWRNYFERGSFFALIQLVFL